MFYIEENDKIVLFDQSKGKLVDTIKFLPQYQNLEIKETDRPIENFEFADTEEYRQRKAQEEKEIEIEEIKSELAEIDLKRIRAVCENEVKDEETGETWLEYYNLKIHDLRERLAQI